MSCAKDSQRSLRPKTLQKLNGEVVASDHLAPGPATCHYFARNSLSSSLTLVEFVDTKFHSKGHGASKLQEIFADKPMFSAVDKNFRRRGGEILGMQCLGGVPEEIRAEIEKILRRQSSATESGVNASNRRRKQFPEGSPAAPKVDKQQILKNLGRRIRKLREAKGLTLSEVTGSLLAFKSSQDWQAIENGDRNLSVATALKVAQTLDVQLDELFKGIEAYEPDSLA